MKTYYDLLHVSQNANDEIIISAFEYLTQKHSGQGTMNSHEFENILRAYDCLINHERRARYDEKLRNMREVETQRNKTIPDNKSFQGKDESLIVVAIFVIIFGLVLTCVVGSSFTYTWTKTDVSESKERYSEVQSDSYNHCAKREDWTDCTNSLVQNYNSVCVGRIFEDPNSLCKNQSRIIDEMKKKSRSGVCSDAYYYGECVVKDGDFYGLEIVDKERSIPPVTHEAVCTWGLWGECKK